MTASVPGAESLLAAGLIREAAHRLRQAAEMLPAQLRVDAALLCDAARTLAEQAEAAGRAEAETNRQLLVADLKDRARRARVTRGEGSPGPSSEREVIEHLRAVARSRARPASFPAAGSIVHAAAVDAALAGRRAVLDPQDRLYLLARIEALGGPGGVDLAALAVAIDTSVHALERDYRRYRDGLGDLHVDQPSAPCATITARLRRSG